MPTPDGSAEVTRAMRLIFEFEGERVTLISQTPVDVAVTGYDLARAQHPGYYIDTRNATGDVMTRVHARNAFLGSMEVFPEKAGEPITRVEVPNQRGAFTVVVPAPEGADHITLVRIVQPAATDAARALQPAQTSRAIQEIATFPLLPSK